MLIKFEHGERQVMMTLTPQNADDEKAIGELIKFVHNNAPSLKFDTSVVGYMEPEASFIIKTSY